MSWASFTTDYTCMVSSRWHVCLALNMQRWTFSLILSLKQAALYFYYYIKKFVNVYPFNKKMKVQKPV